MTAVTRRPRPAGRQRRRQRMTEIRAWDRRAAVWRRFLHHRVRTAGHRPLHLSRLRAAAAPHSADLGPHLRPQTVVLAPGGGVSAVLTSRTTWDVAAKLNRAVAPVAVALDAARMGLAVKQDGGLGRHSARTGASIAGSWAGGYAGGVTGSHTGAALGAMAGPIGMVLGGLTGGLVGAVAGAIGLAKLSEKGVDRATEARDEWKGRLSGLPRRRRPVRFKNELRRGCSGV